MSTTSHNDRIAIEAQKRDDRNMEALPGDLKLLLRSVPPRAMRSLSNQFGSMRDGLSLNPQQARDIAFGMIYAARDRVELTADAAKALLRYADDLVTRS
ncbi:hypothetical protein [Pseudomonas viridiflava]|uniref:hypothetical protein n=2 Tax=Pseudomonas viridiflava TaxID=33069 RepID=UPI000F01E590|nr:hypothetical protein [Pseudomonas viridiflava]MEE4124018.1 hypothetical protein [Pseudomonas viridiflava]